MNTKVQQTDGAQGPDVPRLALAALILAAGIFAYYWFGALGQLPRLGMLVAGIVVAGAIAWSTGLGHKARHFIDETWFEMRKVVWPTRDDTIKTTVVVIIVTIILAGVLGLIDLVYKSIILDWLLKLGQ